MFRCINDGVTSDNWKYMHDMERSVIVHHNVPYISTLVPTEVLRWFWQQYHAQFVRPIITLHGRITARQYTDSVRNRFPRPTSLKQLEHASEEMYKHPLDTAQNLYESISRRTVADLKAKIKKRVQYP
jgi:hypothetical protein